MSGLAAGGSDPESDAGAVAPAGATPQDGGQGGDTSMLEPPELVPDLCVQLDAGILPSGFTDSVVRGLVQAVDRLEDLGVRFMPDNGGRRETDQHVPRLEDPDPEELFGQETHIDVPWDQGELAVTFAPLASRRGSSTDFRP